MTDQSRYDGLDFFEAQATFDAMTRKNELALVRLVLEAAQARGYITIPIELGISDKDVETIYSDILIGRKDG